MRRSFAEEYESKRRDNSDGQCTVCVDYESLEFLVPSVANGPPEKASDSHGRASDGENRTAGTYGTGNDDGKAEPRTPTEKWARPVRNVGGRETNDGGGGYRAAGGLRDVGPTARGRGSDHGDRDRGMPGSGEAGPTTVEEHRGRRSDDSGESSVAVRTPAERRESGNRRRPGYYNIGTDDGNDDTGGGRTSAAKRRKSGRKAARTVRPATVHDPRSYMLLFLPLNATTFPVAADWRVAGGRHAYSSSSSDDDDTDPWKRFQRGGLATAAYVRQNDRSTSSFLSCFFFSSFPVKYTR